MPSPKSQEYDVMLPFGSVEDRPSKKTYQPGIGYCGWKSNEATGGEASGAAGDETGGGKGPPSIAGVSKGRTPTRELKSFAKRPTCVRLGAIVSRPLDRRELRAAGGRHRRIHQIAPIAMAAAATEARIHEIWSDTKPTRPPALGPSGGTGASASMYTVVPST